jgi:hypothetical protein
MADQRQHGRKYDRRPDAANRGNLTSESRDTREASLNAPMHPDQFTDSPRQAAAIGGMMRLADAAREAGMTPYLFQRACELQQIPITLQRAGRLYFVRAEELNAWLRPARTRPAPPAAACRPVQ